MVRQRLSPRRAQGITEETGDSSDWRPGGRLFLWDQESQPLSASVGIVFVHSCRCPGPCRVSWGNVGIPLGGVYLFDSPVTLPGRSEVGKGGARLRLRWTDECVRRHMAIDCVVYYSLSACAGETPPRQPAGRQRYQKQGASLQVHARGARKCNWEWLV